MGDYTEAVLNEREKCRRFSSSTMNSALDRQVGGDHYRHFQIQPIEYIVRNGIGFLPGCIIKRISRYNQPTGKGLEDLEKIRHEIDLLIELEGWKHKAPE